MTIEYKDSKRISGLSSDIVETATYTDDFDTDDWDNMSSRINVNTTTEKLDFAMYRDGANDSAVHDLGVGNVSDTKWVLRWKMNFTAVYASGNGNRLWFGLSSLPQTTNQNTAQDSIMMYQNHDGTDCFSASYSNGTALPQTNTENPDYATGTDYYCELKRTSSTTIESRMWTGGYDGTLLSSAEDSVSNSTIGSVTGLRYVKMSNIYASQGGSVITGTIDDIEFYNGVSSLSSKPTDVQDNSILMEKDTGKRYWFSENKVSTTGLKAYYNFDDDTGGLINQATTGDGLGSSANGVNTSITLDTTNEKLGTGCYDFNGSSSKVVLGSASVWSFLSSATANTWSIVWWMKYEDTIENGHTIMSTTDGGTQTDGMFIDNSGTSGDIRLIQVDGNNGSWSSAIPDNTSWHHYAITWNAGTVTLYVDGVSKGTQSQTAGSGTPQYGLNLGVNNDDYYTELTLDDMSIWSRVLTTSEISALYNSGTGAIMSEVKSATWTQEWNGSPNSVADLQGWWDASASDSTVSLLVDKSGNGYNLTQGTSARQPSVVSGAQNSLNALQFAPNTSNYASEMMQNTSIPNAKVQTVFYVGKVTKTTSGNSGYNYYIWDGSSNDNYNGITQQGDTWKIYAGNSPTTVETTWGIWRNLTMQYNGSSSILRDRGSQETVALTLEGSTDTGFTLNGYANGGDYGGTQDFGELIVYNRALTDTEIANVESYLTTKWGL